MRQAAERRALSAEAELAELRTAREAAERLLADAQRAEAANRRALELELARRQRSLDASQQEVQHLAKTCSVRSFRPLAPSLTLGCRLQFAAVCTTFSTCPALRYLQI